MRTIRTKKGARDLQTRAESLKSTKRLIFLLHNVQDPYNVGGMFRVADACGVKEIVLCGTTPNLPHPQISVTSLGHHRSVKSTYFVSPQAAVEYVKAAGFELIAVELTDEAVPHVQFDFPDKTCLVLGNEERGINETMLRQCKGSVFIPMLGNGKSLNVHVAGAIIAYEALFHSKD